MLGDGDWKGRRGVDSGQIGRWVGGWCVYVCVCVWGGGV